MKKILLVLTVFHLFAVACSKGDNGNPEQDNASIEQGIVKGRITDAGGNPIAGAKIVIEHTVYYATYVYAISDSHGYYRAAVPNGSWQASVQIERSYLNRIYKFDLHPAIAAPFAGTTGAVRNFTWKLSGPKPNGGYYGSNVAVYSEPGSSFMMEEVELSLTPDGSLLDGTPGQLIKKGLIDIGGGEDGINDVPIGKYIITARNKTTNQPLQIRMRNTGNYSSAVTGIFTAGFTGSTGYQIVVQVK